MVAQTYASPHRSYYMINEKPVCPVTRRSFSGARMTSGSARLDGAAMVPDPRTEERTSGSGDKLALAGASKS
jgi:hypothetical protein